jgi:8-oxo-dGTP pyrophosphatase MutT (NUDIX family)
MKLLATFRASDVDPDAPRNDYSTFKPRIAGRAIIFDDAKVALLSVSKHGYYMLPGGGAENEDVQAALIREVMEEIGCRITIDQEVGSIETYFDRWERKQFDFCYTAHKKGDTFAIAKTEFEKEEGHEILWAQTLDEAIRVVEGADPKNLDGKLVRTRDLLFLKSARKITRN